MAQRNATRSRKSTTKPADNTEAKAVSKAEAIRQYKADHPDAGPNEIAEAVAKQGIEVNPGRVSAVLQTGGRNVTVRLASLPESHTAQAPRRPKGHLARSP